MPTSKTKNILYRLALPFFAPSVSSAVMKSRQGYPLKDPDGLFSILVRNHVSGSAIHLQSGSLSASVFSGAVHTDFTPDEHTFFRVASITKMATALLSVRLMDKGILDPEAPAADLLPDGKKVPEIKGIRFSQLLSHTSGLCDPPGLEKMLIEKTPYSEAVSGCRIHEPGSVFRYSNLGYGLIGSALENLLNEPLGQIYSRYLFEPLEMHATLEGCTLPEEKIMPVARIFPYHRGSFLRITELGKIPLDHPDPVYHYGHSAGSMYTDLMSLVRMLQCIRDGGFPVLSDKYSGYMKKEVSQYGKISPTLSYGSGLLIVRDQRISDFPVYGHQGFAYGCVDGAFWEDHTGDIIISLNGGCSEARSGRFGLVNLDLCRWAFRKELPGWK